MPTDTTLVRADLLANIQVAKDALSAAQDALDTFDAIAENNRFATVQGGVRRIEGLLMSRAHADCEGSYNCGDDVYEQEFMVGEVVYVGRLECEYNRHDKTYYYLDSSSFSYSPK